jgi:BolA family transcriptional regulator, general stress-responsive regulator
MPNKAHGLDASEAAVGVSAPDIEQVLLDALQPTALDVTDDSHLHAGHAGAREGRHFSVRITSARFTGMSRVARHRLVYDALHRLIPQGIHALAIQAQSPDEPGAR